MKNQKSKIKNQKSLEFTRRSFSEGGQAAMISVIFFLLISLALIGGFSAFALSEVRSAKILERSKQGYIFAEGGLEDAVYRIKSGKQISSQETISLGNKEVITTITDIGFGNTKEIISTGHIADIIRKAQTQLTTDIGVSFFYGAQIGEGGLKMDESSTIQGAGGQPGNVYSNGSIVGANAAVITGDVTVATSLEEDTQARSIVCNEDQIVGQNNPEIDFAQSFEPSDSKPLSKVSLYIKKVGSPGDRNIIIAADAGGSPAQTSLGTAILSSSLVGSDYAWIDVTFSSPPNLTAGQTYWLILDAKRDANDYWIWCKDKNQGYGNGVAKYSQDWDDDPWTLIVGDFAFRTYLGIGLSSVEDMEILGTVRANTIKDSTIWGDAYYQTIINSDVLGTKYPGSPDPPVENMPISDANIQDWKNAAEAGGVINGNCGDAGVLECDIGEDDTLYLGPKKINGNLVLTKKQTLVVTGTLYFTGWIDMDSASGATVKCDPSFGSNSCVIITDSWVHIKNNAFFQGSGVSGSYLMVLSTLEGCNGGTQQPECTDHNSAMDFLNNATGAIFYTSDSMIYLHNGVNVTEITAYKLYISNNAVVTYEEGLINTNFSSGPGGSWKIVNWKEIP